jgi:hypothetical protein
MEKMHQEQVVIQAKNDIQDLDLGKKNFLSTLKNTRKTIMNFVTSLYNLDDDTFQKRNQDLEASYYPIIKRMAKDFLNQTFKMEKLLQMIQSAHRAQQLNDIIEHLEVSFDIQEFLTESSKMSHPLPPALFEKHTELPTKLTPSDLYLAVTDGIRETKDFTNGMRSIQMLPHSFSLPRAKIKTVRVKLADLMKKKEKRRRRTLYLSYLSKNMGI